MSSGHIYRVATIKLTNVYIVAVIRILVIENSDDMCVVKGLHLAMPAKSPNGFCLQELISLKALKFEKSLQMHANAISIQRQINNIRLCEFLEFCELE